MNVFRTQSLAKHVVDLIVSKKQEGVNEALALLEDYYQADPQQVIFAYEKACLVAMKELVRRTGPDGHTPISPSADWFAISAGVAAKQGNLPKSFELLRSAQQNGSRRGICRKIANEILRKLPLSEKLIQIDYQKGTVELLEIGLINGTGIIMLESHPESMSRAEWKKVDPGNIDQSLVLLRSLYELNRDAQGGYLKFDRVGKSKASMSRINWVSYLRKLKR